MEKVIFALVNNEPEVLMRVTGFLRRVDFHIKSISMSEVVSDPSLAHLTIRTEEEDRSIERAIRNIEKFINVHAVIKMEDCTSFSRKRDKTKARAKESNLYELLDAIDTFDLEGLKKLKNTGTNGII
ncbi:MAG TPA: hypothetical protein GX503_06090 [Clostridiales bacterium]|nr:hypothetical protein [Clostridiales bacterium]